MRGNFADPKKQNSGRYTIMSAAALRDLIRSNSPHTASSGRNLGRRAKTREYIHRLEEILRESPHLPLNLSDLASILDLEKTYCCKIFREIIGKSFSEWIRGIRIDHARDLLLLDDHTITYVSLASGFGDITTFERNFRKVLGLSPRLFRKMSRHPTESALQKAEPESELFLPTMPPSS